MTKTVTRPDGFKDAVVDIYSRNVPGTVAAMNRDQTAGTANHREHAGARQHSGSNTQRQRANVSRSRNVGPARQLSQTVCKGDCKPPKDDK